MGHIFTDLVVKGAKGERELKEVLIDTGATYTVLPEAVLEEIGAWGPVSEIDVELGDGRKVKARSYGVRVRIKDAEAPAICIAFEGAQTVIGVETLESAGLKLDPTKGTLEFTRPSFKGHNTAYLYPGQYGGRRLTNRSSG
jgi:predicted aspartyl protease